jgi:starch synthase (maltosyl-transferring)
MFSSSGPIRIAFCITDLDPGGAERALVQIVTRLDRSRWDPLVICLSRPGALVEPLQAAGIPVVCLGARRPTDLGILPRLYRELRRFRPRILQTMLFHANIAGRLIGWLAGVEFCVSGIRVAERRSRWPLRIDRWTDRFVKVHVCVSRAVRDFCVDVAGLSNHKLVVIPNGVDVASFAEAEPLDLTTLGIPAGARVVAVVGRLDPQKGLEYLIEAAALIAPQHHDVHFLLVGDGPERDNLIRRVAEHDLADRIHFAGWRADVPRILAAAYCLVLPSLWEGMPNVVLEAMAAGIPVLATRVEGVGELVIPEETGVLVPPASASALAKGLECLLNDEARAKKLGRAGRLRAESQFSWDAVASAYHELYFFDLEH